MIIHSRCRWLPILAAARLVAADFPELYNTEKSTQTLSTATEAVARIRLPPGFRATLSASEPEVQNPIAMAFDGRGRLWVAENYTYAEQAINFDTRLRDRVLIFEDPDGDGRFDSRKVFWDGAQKLTSVELGFGGVWLMCPPQLLFLPDRNADDVPDGPPEVVLDGFDADKIRHNFANGLKWGPDGWLYGRHGITTSSFVGPPGTPPDQRIEINCSLWRYHPVTRAFDVLTRGGTNPWGHDWDEFGELFYINTVIGHLWHAVPGGYYQRMFGEHGDPHLYGIIGHTADHYHWDTTETWNQTAAKGVSTGTDARGGGHAHSGLMLYLGDNWPDTHRGQLFTVNLHGHRLNSDRLERSGAGYVARHGTDFAFFDDPWFRGIELAYGPDGGVFVLDWSDLGECHENDGVHRASGRIYKITYGERPTRPAAPLNLASLPDADLANLQFHPNEWFVRQARRVLQERAVRGLDQKQTHADLRREFESRPDAPSKLRALWALFVTGAATPDWLAQLARTAPDEHLRAWVIRLLFDAVPGDITTRFIGGTPAARAELPATPPRASPAPTRLTTLQAGILPDLARLASSDASGLVQLHLASLLQKLPLETRLELAGALASNPKFAQDAMLAHLIWYGVQPAVPTYPERALATLVNARQPFYRQAVARRLTTEMDRIPAVVDGLVKLMASRPNPLLQEPVLKGMSEAVRGWRQAKAPASWATLAPNLTGSTNVIVSRLARELSVVFGDGRAIDELKQILSDRSGDLETRKRAIEALTQSRAEGLVPHLLAVLNDHDLAPAAIRGMAAINQPDTAELLLQALPKLYPPGRAEAINTLTSKPAFAFALLDAIKSGQIARTEVPAFNIRQMRSLEHPDLNPRLDALWPPRIILSADKQKQLEAWKSKLAPARLAAADPAKGREHFKNICGACHKLYGEGAAIAPDLTGSDRRNLDYLLENILDPSAVVAADYRVAMVTLKDDRFLNGIIGVKTARTLELQTPTEKLTLEQSDIESIEQSQLSLMPEGLIDPLPEDQIRDLLAYLMSPAPPPAPRP